MVTTITAVTNTLITIRVNMICSLVFLELLFSTTLRPPCLEFMVVLIKIKLLVYPTPLLPYKRVVGGKGFSQGPD